MPRHQPSLGATAGQAPQKVTRAFAGALGAADLDRALSFFDEDGCFITPDVTAVRGLQGIRAILSQLIASRAQLQVEPRSTSTAGSLALCGERWTFIYDRGNAAPFVQGSDSTILLRRSNRAWRLLIAAPWGIADADRLPFVGMPWPQ
jgi:ketosteroid isomerase-like protein